MWKAKCLAPSCPDGAKADTAVGGASKEARQFGGALIVGTTNDDCGQGRPFKRANSTTFASKMQLNSRHSSPDGVASAR